MAGAAALPFLPFPNSYCMFGTAPLRSLFALALTLFAAFLGAQDLYTIKVGTFRDVKADDFTTLRSKGFVYGMPGADNTVDVYLGQFTDAARLNASVSELRNGGFRNAQPVQLATETGLPVTVIQIALQANNRPIDWTTLEKAGQLYVESIDGVNKILTGIYPDAKTAAGFLPAIRQLGYTDAFVRTISNARLIPIRQFETGIKKPLIPITLQAPQPQASTSVPMSPAPQPSAPAPAPVTYGNPAPAPAPAGQVVVADPAPTPLPSPAAAAALPAIDGKTKRHSAAELQRVLKEKGYYTGSIDGLYGPGTTTAYRTAWEDMAEIRKYRKLSEILLAPAGERDLVSEWPEIKVLLAITEDIAAGLGNDTRARALVQQRAQLRDAAQPLTAVAASRVNNWATTVWDNLNGWAAEDPLHAQIVSALRVAYHQSQVRLEDYYMDRGMQAITARDLATAMLQNLTGAQLDRFL